MIGCAILALAGAVGMITDKFLSQWIFALGVVLFILEWAAAVFDRKSE